MAAYQVEDAGGWRDRDTAHRFADCALAVQDAVGEGYFHWTLLDDFEWPQGHARRFGLVHVDCVTLARLPRDGSSWYPSAGRPDPAP